MICMHRESAPNYIFVVQVFSNDCRLVECRDHTQWIVQRWTGNRWRNERFFRTKAALAKYVCRLGLSVDELADLPDSFSSKFGFGQAGNHGLLGGCPRVVPQSGSDHGCIGSTEGL